MTFITEDPSYRSSDYGEAMADCVSLLRDRVTADEERLARSVNELDWYEEGIRLWYPEFSDVL